MKDCLMLLYGIPSIIAWERRHPKEDAICKLNLYGGWTVVGWLVSLAWACWPQAASAVVGHCLVGSPMARAHV